MCSSPSLAHRYGEEEWLEKEGCQRITQKSCNLTMETSNVTELYYARVTATDGAGRSATKMTNRFSSLQHSEWGPLVARDAGGRMAFSPLEWVERPEGLCLSGPVKDVAFREDAPDWTASPVWSSIFLHL